MRLIVDNRWYKIGEGCADTKAVLDVALEELREDSAMESGVASESRFASGVAKYISVNTRWRTGLQGDSGVKRGRGGI
jgi:hypothetical protein